MKRQWKFLFNGLIVSLLMIAPGLAKQTADANKPLKTIAPDLIIENAEEGEFLDDPADPRHFKPTEQVSQTTNLFGWRMKVRTNRKTVLVQEKGAEHAQPSALPKRLTPKFGYLFAAREIVQGVSPGKYSTNVCVENVPVKTFTWVVK